MAQANIPARSVFATKTLDVVARVPRTAIRSAATRPDPGGIEGEGNREESGRFGGIQGECGGKFPLKRPLKQQHRLAAVLLTC